MSVWVPKQEIKYIKNQMKYGILIDWDLIKKEFKKLNVPKNTHYPLKADFKKCGYTIDLSDRSRGKTTNKLLVALLLFREYGIELQYIRQEYAQLEKQVIGDLYKVVMEHHYIEKIFDNNYNSIFYYGKRWYLCKRDENGEIIDKCENHCTMCLSIDAKSNDHMKSNYNAPRGDMIFHDEFITSHYNFGDFKNFCDLCKTIIRDRVSPVIFMSANTIDKNSTWFDEFCIREPIEHMEQGDNMYIKSDMGTNIYIEILNADISEDRQNVNTRFWGFPNPALSSITGRGTWATETYQHIPHYDNDNENNDKVPPEIINNTLFIKKSGKFVKLQIVNDVVRGLCVFVTPATMIYDDSIICTADDIENKQYIFGLGKGSIMDMVWKLYSANKFYYANNSMGAFIKSYLQYTRTKMNSMYMR